MDKTLKKAAAELAFKILHLDTVEKDAKKRKDKLKNELSIICDSSINSFINDELELPEANAKIKISLNPPSVFDSRTDKALTPKQKEEIARILDDKYCTVAMNIKEIQLSMGADTLLAQRLTDNNVDIRQYARYDVKKLAKLPSK